ncbi:MAG: hypothetical protein V1904_03420 [Bacteroidota bacterium]
MNKLTKLILITVAIVSMTACEKGYMGFAGYMISGANNNKEYYKGVIPCSFYRRNYDDVRCRKITGIPFMVIEYNRTDHHIIDFEFGLCEVTQTTLATPSFPEPTLDASTLDCYKKLDLKDPVVLLVNWPVTAWGETVTNGSLGAGGVIFYYNSYGSTKYTFSYITGQITGGAENLDGTGIETDTMMDFDMTKQ